MDNSIILESTFAYAIIIILAIVSFISGCYLYIKSKDSMNWSKTNGFILDTKLYKSVDGGASPISYKAQIKYSYTVEEKEYISKRIYFGGFLLDSSPSRSKKLLKKYPKGTTVDIYYNPLKPQQSVLQKGVHLDVILTFITVFLFMIFMLIFCYLHK